MLKQTSPSVGYLLSENRQIKKNFNYNKKIKGKKSSPSQNEPCEFVITETSFLLSRDNSLSELDSDEL